MKISNYLFAFLLIFTFSCQDKEDSIPQITLDGTYELATENTDTKLWYVTQYVFNPDGKLQVYHLLRETKDGPAIGYTYYQRSNYSLRGTSFSHTIQRAYRVDEDKNPEGFAEDLEDLISVDLGGYTGAKGTLRQLESGNKIALIFECNDTPGNAMCLGEQEYEKVN